MLKCKISRQPSHFPKPVHLVLKVLCLGQIVPQAMNKI